jgi:hypothetical protein
MPAWQRWRISERSNSAMPHDCENEPSTHRTKLCGEPFDYFEARRWHLMRRYCALISTNAELDAAALGQLSGVLPVVQPRSLNEATNSPSPSARTQAWGCFL